MLRVTLPLPRRTRDPLFTGDLRIDAIFESYRGTKLCKIVFAPFLHSRSPLFERNDQLLRKRISLDYIKSKLLPIRLQKLKYRSSCISTKHLYGQIPYFGHSWRAFEGFDFVGEAADVGIGRAFGLFRNKDVKKFPCSR